MKLPHLIIDMRLTVSPEHTISAHIMPGHDRIFVSDVRGRLAAHWIRYHGEADRCSATAARNDMAIYLMCLHADIPYPERTSA